MEEEEYDRIVRNYMDVIYRVAVNGCKNPEDAQDVVQNTFMKLLESELEFGDEEHIRKWLIRVAVNECKSLWRTFWRRNVSSLEEMETEPVFSAEEKSDLYYAVQKLPARYRVVVHLYYYEDYSVREIADILKVKETTIQTRLMRARSKLKEQLKGAWK